MDYFIKADEWKVIFELLKTVKRIHVKSEAKIRRFFEAIWVTLAVRGVSSDCCLGIMAIGALSIEGSKNGLKKGFGPVFFKASKIRLTWRL